MTKWRLDELRPKVRPRRRWEDHVKEDLRILGVVDGEEMLSLGETQ